MLNGGNWHEGRLDLLVSLVGIPSEQLPSVCTEAVEKFTHRIPAVDHACNLVVCLVNDFNVTKMMFITGKLINISKKTEKKLNVYKLAEYSKSLI